MACLRERYIQPVVDVVFDRVLESVPMEIKSAPHVDRAALDGDRLSVFMRDLEPGKRNYCTPWPAWMLVWHHTAWAAEPRGISSLGW